MAKAKITLTGAMSMAKGRYRFTRNHTVVSDDDALIKECENDGQFAVTRLAEVKAGLSAGSEGKDVKPVGRPAGRPPKDDGDEGKSK